MDNYHDSLLETYQLEEQNSKYWIIQTKKDLGLKRGKFAESQKCYWILNTYFKETQKSQQDPI